MIGEASIGEAVIGYGDIAQPISTLIGSWAGVLELQAEEEQ